MMGDEKIRCAAAEGGYVDRGQAGKKVLAAAQASGIELDDDGAGDRRIRRAAGLPEDDDVLQKALTDLDAAVAAIGRPAPKRHRAPVRAAAKPRLVTSTSPSPRRPAPAPVPARAAPSPPPITLPPRPISPEAHLGFWDFRDRLAGDIRAKMVAPTPEAVIDHAVARYGIGAADAAEWTGRFLGSIQREIERRPRTRRPTTS